MVAMFTFTRSVPPCAVHIPRRLRAAISDRPGTWQRRKIRMSDYEVDYGEPPKHIRLGDGVCANPRGCGRRRLFEETETARRFNKEDRQWKACGAPSSG